MENKNRLRTTLAALLLCTPVVAGAATLQIDSSGQLTGALGVEVGGEFYDVEFVEGTCVALFDGCDDPEDFLFYTDGAAPVGLSRALRDQVLLNGPQGLFDTMPWLTLGCEDSEQCKIFTPAGFTATGVGGTFLNNTLEPATMYNVGAFGANPLLNSFEYDDIVWARWSPAATPVPIPAAAWLLLSGLAALVRFRPVR